MTEATGGSVLAVEGLTLRARVGGRPVELLRDVGFAVGAGRTLGLVGESGAGKSMIGRLISGLLPGGFEVAGGRVVFEGVDLAMLGAGARRALLGGRIAFIPQEPLSALNPVLSIGRQFGEHLARLGVARGARAGVAAEWLGSVHLPDPQGLLGRFPHELSGGQCQRVLIAMAFSSRPALIVADEPTTALDAVTQGRIMALLAEQQGLHGAAVVLITHDLHLAAQVCDELVVLYAGDMVEAGPAAQVLARPEHPYTRSLQASTPALHGPRRVLPNLPEQMPGVVAMGAVAMGAMAGCRFAPRCPARDAGCAAGLPAWRDLGDGHRVRCAVACQGLDMPAGAALADAVVSRRGSGGGAVLTLDGVSLRYPVRRRLFGATPAGVDAVRAVSLEVHPGEFVGLVGESGSGKSSVGRLVMGLERPTGGRVLLDGSDAGPGGLRTPAQIVFQDPQSALNPRRSVFSLVTQALEVPGRGSGAAARLETARRLLAETGLPGDCLGRFPAQLSGGQRQRVNIARALCVTPRLLVADEIVSGLDVSVQAQILNLLLALGRDLGIGLLFISHDLAVVRYLCSRVAVMHRGVIVEAGETEAVFARPQHDYTRSLVAAVPSGRGGL